MFVYRSPVGWLRSPSSKASRAVRARRALGLVVLAIIAASCGTQSHTSVLTSQEIAELAFAKVHWNALSYPHYDPLPNERIEHLPPIFVTHQRGHYAVVTYQDKGRGNDVTPGSVVLFRANGTSQPRLVEVLMEGEYGPIGKDNGVAEEVSPTSVRPKPANPLILTMPSTELVDHKLIRICAKAPVGKQLLIALDPIVAYRFTFAWMSGKYRLVNSQHARVPNGSTQSPLGC